MKKVRSLLLSKPAPASRFLIPRAEACSYSELKCLARSSSSVVHLCECLGTTPPDYIPQSYVESSQRRFRNHPEWHGKRILVVKRRRYSGAADFPSTEVELLTRARPHPHVITFFHAFVDPVPSELCLLLEHMEGNLAQLIKSRKQRFIPEALIRSITAQMASGLECVHALGFAHRSLSTDHILVTTTGLAEYPSYHPSTRPRKDVTVEIKLTGLGHSIKLPSLPGALSSDPTISTYTPPEVLFGETDERLYAADIWSLGCICAELTSLRPLFDPQGRRHLFREWCLALGPPQSPLILGSRVDGQYSPAAVSWAESFGIDLSIVSHQAPLDVQHALTPPIVYSAISTLRRTRLKHRFAENNERHVAMELGTPAVRCGCSCSPQSRQRRSSS